MTETQVLNQSRSFCPKTRPVSVPGFSSFCVSCLSTSPHTQGTRLGVVTGTGSTRRTGLGRVCVPTCATREVPGLRERTRVPPTVEVSQLGSERDVGWGRVSMEDDEDVGTLSGWWERPVKEEGPRVVLVLPFSSLPRSSEWP